MKSVRSIRCRPTRYDDFFVMAGAKLFDYHRGVGSEVGGALDVFAGVYLACPDWR